MIDWREKFARERAVEAEGAAAAIAGKTRADCPYDQASQADEWNFWVYGNENARGEMRVLSEGFNATLMTTADTAIPPPKMIPAEQAYNSGIWKPQYVTVPSSWQGPLSSTGRST